MGWSVSWEEKMEQWNFGMMGYGILDRWIKRLMGESGGNNGILEWRNTQLFLSAAGATCLLN